MPRIFIRLLLFLSSYFPLMAIFAVQLYFKNEQKLAIAILAVGLAGLAGISLYMTIIRRVSPMSLKLESICRKDGEAMSYIVTYILPFIALDSNDQATRINLAIFLVVLGIIYINSNMLHVNPMLNLAGWHLYEVELTDGRTCALLTRNTVSRNRDLNVVQMGYDIYLEVAK